MASSVSVLSTVAPRRTALVVGVANARSIAWSSTRCLLRRGFNVVVTYQNERFAKSVETLVQKENDAIYSESQSCTGAAPSSLPKVSCLPCDVSCDDNVGGLFAERLLPYLHDDNASTSSSRRCRLDALIHSVAYASPDAMKEGTLLDTSRKSFGLAHDTSSYSLLLLARHALPLLTAESSLHEAGNGDSSIGINQTSSITALSYLGATRAVPNYNVMGPAKASLEGVVRGLALEVGPAPHYIRVNAVSAGPINTMAAKGIRGFSQMRQDSEQRSMLRRNVTADEVGNAVAFLAEAEGITGQTLFVDGGYSSVAGPIIQ